MGQVGLVWVFTTTAWHRHRNSTFAFIPEGTKDLCFGLRIPSVWIWVNCLLITSDLLSSTDKWDNSCLVFALSCAIKNEVNPHQPPSICPRGHITAHFQQKPTSQGFLQGPQLTWEALVPSPRLPGTLAWACFSTRLLAHLSSSSLVHGHHSTSIPPLSAARSRSYPLW